MTTWHGTRSIERDPEYLPNPAEALAAGSYAPEDFGAIGDGASHPAGAHLGVTTLAQLRAWNDGVFWFASDLGNEMDYLCWQAALYGGGLVRGRPGAVYRIDHNLVVPNGAVNVETSGCRLSWSRMAAAVADGSTPVINPSFD